MNLFENISRIKTLMEMNNKIVFGDKPTEKQLDRMSKIGESIFKDYDFSKYMTLKYPDNESDEVIDELNTLAEIDVDDNFVEEKDNIYKSYKNLLNKFGYKLNKKAVKDLLEQSGRVILTLKYHYNRPRPFQLNKIHNIEMKNKMMDSMKSPSFPSGHASQGMLVGKILSELIPEHEGEIMDMADDISFSRNMAKAHFPSDTEAGKKLGEDMFKFIKDENLLDELNFLD